METPTYDELVKIADKLSRQYDPISVDYAIQRMYRDVIRCATKGFFTVVVHLPEEAAIEDAAQYMRYIGFEFKNSGWTLHQGEYENTISWELGYEPDAADEVKEIYDIAVLTMGKGTKKDMDFTASALQKIVSVDRPIRPEKLRNIHNLLPKDDVKHKDRSFLFYMKYLGYDIGLIGD